MNTKEQDMLTNWAQLPNAFELIQKVQMALVALESDRRKLDN